LFAVVGAETCVVAGDECHLKGQGFAAREAAGVGNAANPHLQDTVVPDWGSVAGLQSLLLKSRHYLSAFGSCR